MQRQKAEKSRCVLIETFEFKNKFSHDSHALGAEEARSKRRRTRSGRSAASLDSERDYPWESPFPRSGRSRPTRDFQSSRRLQFLCSFRFILSICCVKCRLRVTTARNFFAARRTHNTQICGHRIFHRFSFLVIRSSRWRQTANKQIASRTKAISASALAFLGHESEKRHNETRLAVPRSARVSDTPLVAVVGETDTVIVMSRARLR